MPQSSELIWQLRKTIGSKLNYNGLLCAVVEILEEPPCLVLQAVGARSALQDNQFGAPQRRVQPVFTIPCLSEEGDGELHPELLALGLRLE